jgi:ribosomal protein S18 acetylase RimI-like enzyme
MKWIFDQSRVDWRELANLYRGAPLGDKKPDDLRIAFSNSRFKCFVRDRGTLVAAGRVLADGVDCAYLCDVAVHPNFQGLGLGSAIVSRLKELSAGHKKIILHAKPGTEGFYRRLGFKGMRTAMAIFEREEWAVESADSRRRVPEGDAGV